jgi:hypothetical protein
MLLLRRADAALVETDLAVEQPKAFLPLCQVRRDELAVLLQQIQPLLLAGAGPDQPGVALHVTDVHPGGPQLAQQHQPVEIAVAEPPPPVAPPLDVAEQANPLIPAQRVLRKPGLLRGLPNGPAHHVIRA